MRVQLQMSTNGRSLLLTTFSVAIALPSTPGTVITITIPSGTTLNINNLVLRLLFTGGQSNGNDLQFQLDNIQINGTSFLSPRRSRVGCSVFLGCAGFSGGD